MIFARIIEPIGSEKMTNNREPAAWPFKPLAYNEDAHVISNIGAFKFCRRDQWCRCSRCKPGLKGNSPWLKP